MKVSILVFPGVEELDFVGFLEVLAVANRFAGRRWFDTKLLGTKRGLIECSGGMKVVPDATVAKPGSQDMVFVPGGGASRGGGVDLISKDRRTLEFLKLVNRRGKPVWSVCTGALILGRAGLLKGKSATTHHAFFQQLGALGAHVVQARTVTDGRITTGGGISSSIDVGLTLVRKSMGAKAAREVTKRMEYHPPRRR
jgi:cyclohexyl-isocyanide hydratase